MKIALIGAYGQVGSELRQLCESRKIPCVAWDSTACNITQTESILHAFSLNEGIDLVVNCAAYTAVDRAEEEAEKAFAINATGAAQLASVCRKLSLPLLHLSTDYVFSGEKSDAYNEQDMTSPSSVYGQSKCKGEEEIRTEWEKHVILRVSWVFGRYGNNFVKTIRKLSAERETLRVVADQRGCPTAAVDIAHVILQIAEKMLSNQVVWGTYHYSNSPPTTWFHFAREIVRLSSLQGKVKTREIVPLTTAEFPTRAKRPAFSVLSTKKIEEELGIVRKPWLPFLEQLIQED